MLLLEVEQQLVNSQVGKGGLPPLSLWESFFRPERGKPPVPTAEVLTVARIL